MHRRETPTPPGPGDHGPRPYRVDGSEGLGHGGPDTWWQGGGGRRLWRCGGTPVVTVVVVFLRSERVQSMSAAATVGGDRLADNPLLAAKLVAPRIRTPVVDRPRLVELVSRGVESLLTVVSGAAGSGKTLLLASWCATAAPPGPVAWLTPRPGRRRARRVLGLRHRRAAACRGTAARRRRRAVPRHERRAPPAGPGRRRPGLRCDPGRAGTRPVRGRDEPADPPRARFRPPPRRRRSSGWSCSPGTTGRAGCTATRCAGIWSGSGTRIWRSPARRRPTCSSSTGSGCPRAPSRPSPSRPHGWAAGLRLSALAMQQRGDPAAFVTDLPGADPTLTGYLVDEVLDVQPPDVRDFLRTRAWWTGCAPPWPTH